MKIAVLIAKLAQIRKTFGDLEVEIYDRVSGHKTDAVAPIVYRDGTFREVILKSHQEWLANYEESPVQSSNHTILPSRRA